MADDLFRFQFFNPQNDLVEIGFSNWINFDRVLLIRNKSKTLNKKILYGSMGVYFNPSEIALIDYIYEIKSVLKSNQVSLTVLMHPKFKLPLDVQKKYSDFITFFSFEFDNFDESSSYSDYLEYLSQFDLILSSGSTLLLDACLINKNIAHVNFELTNVPFWESIKRYLDFREYYMKFMALSKTPLIDSVEDLEAFFKLEYASTHQKTVEQDFASRYILGDQNQKSLMELIKCNVLR
jgi:CDP-glycerol glycerophosphotransferase (TagB/SpsB family)